MTFLKKITWWTFRYKSKSMGTAAFILNAWVSNTISVWNQCLSYTNTSRRFRVCTGIMCANFFTCFYLGVADRPLTSQNQARSCFSPFCFSLSPPPLSLLPMPRHLQVPDNRPISRTFLKFFWSKSTGTFTLWAGGAEDVRVVDTFCSKINHTASYIRHSCLYKPWSVIYHPFTQWQCHLKLYLWSESETYLWT